MDILSGTAPTVFDWFLTTVMLVSVVAAFCRGLVRAVLSLSGLIAGVLIATVVQSHVMERVQSYIFVGLFPQILLFAVVVAAVYLSFLAAGGYLKESSAGAGMGLADRLLGSCFGALRGALIGAAVLTVMSAATPRSPAITRSVLAPYVLEGSQAVSFITPAMFVDQTNPFANQTKSTSFDPLEARILNQ